MIVVSDASPLIALVIEADGDVVLIDEKAARAIARRPWPPMVGVLGVLLLVAACEEPVTLQGPFTVVIDGEVPSEAPASSQIPITGRVLQNGVPSNESVSAVVVAGGGTIDEVGAVEPDSEGRFAFTWTLGPAPLDQRLDLDSMTGGEVESIVIRAVVDEPIAFEPFGDVHAWMNAEGREGSTEGLAFDTYRLVLGIPGGLIGLTNQETVYEIETTGDALVSPLGLAFDWAGNLWICDGEGGALRRMDLDGHVTTALSEVAGAPLELPNAVAVSIDGVVAFTDTCRGLVVTFVRDASGAAADIETAAFDVATEGGPNGIAFEAGGGLLVTTENTALLCGHEVDVTAPVAGLHRLSRDPSLKRSETLASGLGVFGDGVAVDIEGNAWAIFDTADGLALAESAVLVFRPDGTWAKATWATDRVFANLAFGTGLFGRTTVYASLLTIPGLVPPESRGVVRFEVGLRALTSVEPL